MKYGPKTATDAAARYGANPPEGTDDPEVVLAYFRARDMRRVRERGEVPDHWTAIAKCMQCGPVWLWHSQTVSNCEWCQQRIRGFAIPTPPERIAWVKCQDCRHFEDRFCRNSEILQSNTWPDSDRICRGFQR